MLEKMFDLLAADMAGAKPTKAGIRFTISYKVILMVLLGYNSIMLYSDRKFRQKSTEKWAATDHSLHMDSLRMNNLNEDIVVLRKDVNQLQKSNLELRSTAGLTLYISN
jgi:hypothetical protein